MQMSLDDRSRRTLFGGLAPEDSAIFLDFDGVLVELAEGPNEIVVPDGLPELLDTLNDRTSGATAIVTGRSIDDLRSHLGTLPDWVAGSHGGEQLAGGGTSAPHPMTGSQEVIAVQTEIMRLKDAAEGIEIEFKPLGAVVHYRRAPDQAEHLGMAARRIAEAHEAFECHPAKMAFEIRPTDVGKDSVVSDWLTKPPFKGRTPVYFGDDLTDEPALAIVQEMGGIAVKVGPGETVASRRVDGPAEVYDALTRWTGRTGSE